MCCPVKFLRSFSEHFFMEHLRLAAGEVTYRIRLEMISKASICFILFVFKVTFESSWVQVS